MKTLLFDLIIKKWFSKIKHVKNIGDFSIVPHRKININGKNLFVEDYVSIGPNCLFDLFSGSYITIKNGCMIGPGCKFYTRTHNYDSIDLKRIPFDNVNYFGDIVINEASWLGDGVIVLPGVTIGKGVIVGAGAVISKDVADYAVIVGNPAKIIKYRDKKIFEELLFSQAFYRNYQLESEKKQYIRMKKRNVKE